MGSNPTRGTMDLTYICVCGHVYDEHEDGFFMVCTIDDCDCEDYEGMLEEDDEDDEL